MTEKYSVEDRGTPKMDTFPKELIKIVYDKNDNVLFGSTMTKGKVKYQYADGEYTTDGIPFIISVMVSYDGIGNKDLPKDAIIMEYEDLPKMFPNNTFK